MQDAEKVQNSRVGAPGNFFLHLHLIMDPKQRRKPGSEQAAKDNADTPSPSSTAFNKLLMALGGIILVYQKPFNDFTGM